MVAYSINNVISKTNVPSWGNTKKYIAIHYLGVVGQNHDIASDGCGAHFYIYWDGTIYQRCSLDAIVWQVGTAGYYTQKHAYARNSNTIGIEMCCKCDGNSSNAEDPYWYFTEATQNACIWLVKKLMKENNIPVENVLRHYDIVNKTCPAPYVKNNKYKTSWTWKEFKAKLTSDDTSTDTAVDIKYKVGTGWSNNECVDQIGAFSSLDNAKTAAGTEYKVFDTTGKQVYPEIATESTTATTTSASTYTVQLGAYKKKANATAMLNKLKAAGFTDAFVKQEGGYYKVQLGVFSIKSNADNLVTKLSNNGFSAIIVIK
jgi:N-acetylmuramoyl-L-alanine amidase CwlA